MRIATWNVNNVIHRLPLLLAWLDATTPDIVALQEVKTTTAEFPATAIATAGYGSIAVGRKTWNGVALLARGSDPVPIRRSLPGDDSDRQARYVEAAIVGVICAALYLPNGNPFPGPKFDYKFARFERLIEHAAGPWKSGHATVLAGDFNVVPTDFDIYKTSSYENNALVQAEPRASYMRLPKQGWTDALRRRHPEEPMYIFWDYRRNRWQRDAGMRIDHILLSKSLGPKLTDAGVDVAVRGMEATGDHAPVWVELSV